MKVQRFRASSFAEAMRQVKETLGDDAVILESRTVQDEGEPSAPEGRRAWRWLGLKSEQPQEESAAKPKEVEITAAIGRDAEALVSHAPTREPAPATPKAPTPQPPQAQELQETQEFALSLALTSVADQLLKEEVETSLVEELLGEAMAALPAEALEEEGPILDHVVGQLFGRIGLYSPHRPPEGPEVLALVGPPGVGKTTLCAKIAAMAALAEKRRVAILTLAAPEPHGHGALKRAAQILGCPFKAIGDAHSLATAMGAFAEVDLVLIDTPSCPPYDARGVEMLKSLLGVFPDANIHLVLSPTMRDSDLQAAVKGFGSLGLQALIFTGLDVAASYGGILNACEGANLSLSYFSYGPEIPGDLEVATRERVVDLLLNLSGRG